nr:MAG TPA: hypothetical protein [Bacteriophage sp.]
MANIRKALYIKGFISFGGGEESQILRFMGGSKLLICFI